jgi:hypothetical protein
MKLEEDEEGRGEDGKKTRRVGWVLGECRESRRELRSSQEERVRTERRTTRSFPSIRRRRLVRFFSRRAESSCGRVSGFPVTVLQSTDFQKDTTVPHRLNARVPLPPPHALLALD